MPCYDVPDLPLPCHADGRRLTTMLAFIVRKGVLAAKTKPIPRLRPGWALVRVRLAGICNTDIEILRGYHDFRGTLGHEFVGEVVRVAEAVRAADVVGAAKKPARVRHRVGRRVAGEINIGCAALGRKRLCAFCRRGIVSHCAHRRVLGIIDQDGAFAEYITLPLANLHPVPASVSDEQAVFAEPLAAGCQILEQVRVAAHREAAVLGDGKLAQLIARVLRAAGVRVTVFGRHANKLALARPGESTRCACARQTAGALPPALLAARRSNRIALGLRAGAGDDEAARNGGAEVHVPRRSGDRDLADRRERTDADGFAVRAVSASAGAASRRRRTQSGSAAADFARVSAARGSPAMRFAARRGVMKVLLKP